MIVKSKKISALLKEGPHIAELTSVTGKPNDKEPKKVVLKFQVDGRNDVVAKEVPASVDEHKPLRKDAEVLLGRQLTAKEAEDGLELDDLVGHKCQIVVAHKSGVGGRPTAVVTLLQPLPEAPVPAGR